MTYSNKSYTTDKAATESSVQGSNQKYHKWCCQSSGSRNTKNQEQKHRCARRIRKSEAKECRQFRGHRSRRRRQVNSNGKTTVRSRSRRQTNNGEIQERGRKDRKRILRIRLGTGPRHRRKRTRRNNRHRDQQIRHGQDLFHDPRRTRPSRLRTQHDRGRIPSRLRRPSHRRIPWKLRIRSPRANP